jgi:hypothetical protein
MKNRYVFSLYTANYLPTSVLKIEIITIKAASKLIMPGKIPIKKRKLFYASSFTEIWFLKHPL